jgi:hypothetical protein
MLLFIIGLIIYIYLTNDKCIKRILIISILLFFINNIYKVFKYDIIENGPDDTINTTDFSQDYKKMIFDLLYQNLDTIKNKDIFEYAQINDSILPKRLLSNYYIKIKPINFIIFFMNIKKYNMSDSKDAIEYINNKGNNLITCKNILDKFTNNHI